MKTRMLRQIVNPSSLERRSIISDQ